MSILWDVPEVITNPSGGVIEVRYSVSKGLAIRTGVISFTPDSTSESYVSFGSLTKDEIIAWVKSVLTQTEVDRLEDAVSDEFDSLDTQEYPVAPWGMSGSALNKAMSGISDEDVSQNIVATEENVVPNED